MMSRLFLKQDQMAASRGNIPSLDGLRAISVLTVLSAHFFNANIIPGGLGVYVFFVISGFLITRLLLIEHSDTGSISLRGFYLRRIFRLYPVIIVFTVVVITIYSVTNKPYNLMEPASALGYFANYEYVYLEAARIPVQMPFNVFWSLSVEEHFYILFPLLFLALRGDPKRLIWAMSTLCVTCLVLRLEMAYLHPESLRSAALYTETQYRLDSIGFGVILALACQSVHGRWMVRLLSHPAVAASALLVVVVCLYSRDPWFRETFRYTLLGCAIDVLVAAVLFGEWLLFIQKLINTAIFVWIGRLSYSLYVWHEGVASFLPITNWPHWQVAIINFTATAVVAAISYYAVEKPLLRLRQHIWSPRPAKVFARLQTVTRY